MANSDVSVGMVIVGEAAVEILSKSRALYARIDEIKEEQEALEERAKGCKKRVEAFQAEIRDLVMAEPSPQIEMVPHAEGESRIP